MPTILSLLCALTLASQPLQWEPSRCDTKALAERYGELRNSTSLHLASRDVPALFQQYATGPTILDYGCGPGHSTNFLAKLGYNVLGASTGPNMLMKAGSNYPQLHFMLIKACVLPLLANSQDGIYSHFVLLEHLSKDETLAYLREAERVLKPGACLVILTSSEHMFTGNWSIYNANYPENANLKDGDKARIYWNDGDIEFTNVFWTENTVKARIQEAGLELREVLHPLASSDDGRAWKDELTQSPFAIFVATKPLQQLGDRS